LLQHKLPCQVKTQFFSGYPARLHQQYDVLNLLQSLPTLRFTHKHWLFFVLRVNICNTRRISSSRPITGSSFPSHSFRFFAYLFNELYVSSAEAEVTLSPFLNSSMAAFNPFQ
jgi:hypothetical protein